MSDDSPSPLPLSWFTWPFELAPRQLQQTINPWSFGNVYSVTHLNSSAPDVEREVLSRHSYGRQIGRLMDAVSALVEDSADKHDDKRLLDFRALASDVQQIKREAAPKRIERLRKDLERVKQDDPQGWARLRDLFRE